MNTAIRDHYLCPQDFIGDFSTDGVSGDNGYFLFGEGTLCYGRTSLGAVAARAPEASYDALRDVSCERAGCRLPFDPREVIDNLRLERYASGGAPSRSGIKSALKSAYYLVRPLMPVRVRRRFQSAYLRGWDQIPFPAWPVDCTVERVMKRLLALSMKSRGVERIPFIWFWPDNFSCCVMMTHDVETAAGRDFCGQLMDTDESFGIHSAFQVVPEQRYEVPSGYLDEVRRRGFEINIHGLNHDGRLFWDYEEFKRRAKRINEYGRKFGASGFRSPVLYRNLDWFSLLEFSYDMTVPNVAHLDPQRGGCCTVMPYFIGDILELPLTTIQDYSLFNVLNDYSIDLWKKQMSIISAENGLISFNVHPDYISNPEAYGVYEALLGYIREAKSGGNAWVALPKEIDAWWRQRQELRLVQQDSKWTVEGPGSERASVAFAALEGDEVVYRREQR